MNNKELPVASPTSLIVFEQPLAERLSLSQEQQRATQNLAVEYLRRNGLDFHQVNLKAAILVLGADCLQRGMLLSGRIKLAPDDSVRTLIREGFKHREKVHKIVETVLEGSHPDFLSQTGNLVGPLALERNALSEARSILARFQLTPNISVCDKLVLQSELRRYVLPKLAELAISTLPREVFPQASIDRFPSPAEQAKLVRNMLTSLALSDLPTPIISIETLRRFSEINQEEINDRLSAGLLPNLNQFFPEETELASEETRRYLADLLIQTRETFLEHNPERIVMDSKVDFEMVMRNIRDRLYRNFSRTLLLLHPALEERPLITIPSRVWEDEYSLWHPNFSVVIDDKRIPTPRAILIASRLANARGYDPSRYHEALSAWKNLPKEEKQEGEKCQKLAADMARLNQEIAEVRMGRGNLPSYAVFLARDFYNRETRYFTHSRSVFNRYQSVIAGAIKLRSQTKNYLEELNRSHHGELPESALLPDWVLEQRVIAVRRAEISKKGAAERKLSQAIQLLQEDFFYGEKSALLPTERWGEKDNREVEDEMKRLKSLGEQITASENISLSPGENEPRLGDVVRYIDSYIGDIRFRRYDAVEKELPGDRDRIIELKNLKKLLEEEMNNRKDDPNISTIRVPKGFYMFVIRNRIFILQLLLNARMLNEEAKSQKEIPNQWSKEEILEWSKRAMVATIPFDSFSQSELREHLRDLRDYSLALLRSREGEVRIVWPDKIPSRGDFKEWADRKVAKKDDENKIEILSKFSKILDNPLFPLPEGEDLKSGIFWGNFSRRIRLLVALTNIDEAREEFLKARADFSTIERRVYLEYLERRKDGCQKELTYLEQNQPAKTKFLRRMKELDLVLEAT